MAGNPGDLANKGRAEAHVIEILTGSGSPALPRLSEKRGRILYSRGENGADRQLAMEKLYRLFHIKMLLICGGGGRLDLFAGRVGG